MRKLNIRLIFILLFGSLNANIIFAGNTGTISGIVVDSTGLGISWVTVAVKQAKLAEYSDIKGNFTITNVPEGVDTVLVSYIGFLTQNIPVNVKAGERIRISVVLRRNKCSSFDITE